MRRIVVKRLRVIFGVVRSVTLRLIGIFRQGREEMGRILRLVSVVREERQDVTVETRNL